MSNTNEVVPEESFNDADSKADSIAIFLLIMITVSCLIYFVS